MADSSDGAVLVINDGALAGLTACLMAEDRRVVMWTPPEGSALLSVEAGVDSAARRSIVARQAEVLGHETVIARPPVLERSDRPAGGLRLAVDLIVAAADGAAHGCRRVVWPVVCGEDLDRLFEAAECAELIGRLASLETLTGLFNRDPAQSPPDPATLAIRVETPFIDLTPDQVAALADDLDAPRELCLGESAGGASAERP